MIWSEQTLVEVGGAFKCIYTFCFDKIFAFLLMMLWSEYYVLFGILGDNWDGMCRR